jgi:MFS family permease
MGGYMGGPAWNSLLTDLIPARERGKVLGLMGTIAGIIGLPAAYIGGYIYDRNPAMLLVSGSLLEALSIPIILFFIRDPKSKQILLSHS